MFIISIIIEFKWEEKNQSKIDYPYFPRSTLTEIYIYRSRLSMNPGTKKVRVLLHIEIKKQLITSKNYLQITQGNKKN